MTHRDAETHNDGAQGVVVHGMGRSGTSAITGLFVRSGFYVGHDDDLMPPAPDNPVGYNENLKVYEVNERVLADLGGTWFAPPEEASQLRAGAVWEPEIRAVFTSLLDAAGPAPLVVKDPRIEVLLPLWGGVLRDTLHPVIAVRDPIEIALSLRTREEMPLPFGLAAWELHMTTLLRHLDGQTATIAPYRLLMSSASGAHAIVAAATECLTEEAQALTEPSDGSGWLRPDLYRNRVHEVDHDQYLTVHQRELWNWLDALPLGNLRLRPPAALTVTSDAAREAVAAERERAANATEAWEATQREAQLQARYGELQGRHGELQARCGELQARGDELTARLSELEAGHADLDARHADLQATYGALLREHDRLRRDYGVVVSSRSWRMMGPARALGRQARSLTRRARTGGGA